METPNNSRRWIWGLALVCGAVGAIWYFGSSSRSVVEEGAIFVARRGPLDITVLEGGSIQALESQEIKCEVKVGYQGTKILKIVEEGYLVTESDVTNGKVLVELDSSEIQKQIVQQEISYESSAASLTEAQQGYDIQLNQNLSDVEAAEQKVRFARLDLDKFLGMEVSTVVLEGLDLNRILNPVLASNTPPATTTNAIRSAEQSRERPQLVSFKPYARLEALGDGEAKQKLRKFIDDHLVAQKELEQAQVTLEGTRRLFGKGFVTRNDLQRDEIAFENSRLKVQTAATARDLYLNYEFIKTAEETLSKHLEALRELNRARKASVSKLAQADAKRKSAEAQFNVQLRQRKDLADQLEKCMIKAKKPGLVVYGGGDDGYYWGNEGRVREGATVRERQTIITIPDLSRMLVKVSIHESYIKKVKKGQKVRITVDAFPDKELTGEVYKVGVLPDSQNRWLNPDLKVYQTTIHIAGTQDWIKPGMTAKVQILVQHLDNVLQVPVQAIVPTDKAQTCIVVKSGGHETRTVETGEFSDDFIQITKGLSEGDRVLLRRVLKSQGSESEPADKKSGAGSKTAPAASTSSAQP